MDEELLHDSTKNFLCVMCLHAYSETTKWLPESEHQLIGTEIAAHKSLHNKVKSH